jgi:hypothetical protein
MRRLFCYDLGPKRQATGLMGHKGRSKPNSSFHCRLGPIAPLVCDQQAQQIPACAGTGPSTPCK